MLKRILLFLSCSAVVPAYAQLTFADFPTAGDVFNATLYDTTGVQAGNSGTGQTWIFNTLVANGGTQTDSFLLPGATPYAASFPASNLAQRRTSSVGGNSYYIYFDKNTSTVERLGIRNVNLIPYSDPASQYHYPFAYNDSYSDTYSGVFTDTNNDSVHVSGSVTVHADASGTITTPFNTYSALRIKATRTEYDTIFSSPQQTFVVIETNWNWYTPGVYYPVLSITQVNVAPSFGPAIFQKIVAATPIPPLGISPVPVHLSSFSVFPNPGGGPVEIVSQDGSAISHYTLSDLAGKIVLQQEPNTARAVISCGELAAGVYLLSLLNENGLTETQRLIIR